MLKDFQSAPRKPRIGFFAAHLSSKLLSSFPARLFRSPGHYALIAGPVAVFAVFSPRAAPDWFFVLCLVFSVPALVLALWTALTLGMTLRRYRAEAIGFDHAVRGLSRAARGFFRAGQLGALAFAFGLAAIFYLAFPGLAILAGLLVPVLAVALSVLPGAVLVPRHADAGLALVVLPRTLPLGKDPGDRFRIAWRFAARMGAVRAAVADRQAVLPPEARDIAKALDGGGMVRPPVNRLTLDPVGGLWLRGRGLAAVLSAALPIALVAWLLAALMPPGALPALPRPTDLWAFATSEGPPSADAPSAPEDEPAEDPPGQESSATSPDSASADAGGSEPDADGSGGGQGADPGSDGSGQGGEGQPGGAGADGSGGGQGADAGSDGAGQTGEGQPGGAGADGSGDGQAADPGSDGGGQGGEGQPGGAGADGSGDGQGADAGSDGAGQAGEGQPGGAGADGSGGGQGADAGSDGAGQAGEGQPGGAGADGSGGGQGADSGPDGAGQSGEGQPGGGGADGSAEGQGGEAQPGGAGGEGSGGSADGAAAGGDPGPAGGTDGSATEGAGSGDGMTAGDPAAVGDPAVNREITEGGSGGDPGSAIVSGPDQGTDVDGRLPSPPAAEGGEDLKIGTPPSLFAPPGSAPPAVLRDLTPEAVTEMPPGPAIPPRQRLPAWIADLYQ